jgi:hypothetical protein
MESIDAIVDKLMEEIVRPTVAKSKKSAVKVETTPVQEGTPNDGEAPAE